MMRESLRVCLISPLFYPDFSGAAERFRRYSPGLRQRGVFIEVIASQTTQAGSELTSDIVVQRFPIAGRSLPPTADLLHQACQMWKAANTWPAVIQLFDVPRQAAYDLWRAKRHGCRLLAVGTMVFDLNHIATLTALKMKFLFRLSYASINRVVVSTTVMADQYARLGIPVRRIQIIPNGVNVQRFRPANSLAEKSSLRRSLGFNAEDEIVLFVGSVIPRKGVDLLIQAWSEVVAQHPLARLLVVGPYRNQLLGAAADGKTYLQQIDALVQACSTPERIIFTEEVRNIEDYMRIADVFVLPSRYEGMGNVVLEAMASGLPCIVTPYHGLPLVEFGRPEREYLVASYTPADLAANISKVLSSREIQFSLGGAARQWVSERLDVEKTLDEYAHIYRIARYVRDTNDFEIR